MDFTIPLQLKSTTPIYIQIYDHIKREILKGMLPAGTRLPSHRNLASQLNVSRITVESAYQQLSAEGYVESKPKRGIFVAKVDIDVIPIEQNSLSYETSKRKEEQYDFDCSQGIIDQTAFPISNWKRALQETLLQYENHLFSREDPQGEFILREHISKYLYHARGVNSSPDQIIIGAGTQPLLWLLLQLLGPTKVYGIENPGFHRVNAIVKSCGLPIHPIPLDEKGIDISALRKSHTNVAYVTPSHQFPYGMIMPLSRRLELLKWANDCGGYIIEDDYDGEFRYVGKPIPSLQGLDSNERVIYMGTFSKCFLPSLRMGYIVLPNHLLQAYKELGGIFKQTVSTMQQLAFATFIQKGDWDRHINRIRTLYKRKHIALVTSITSEMGTRVNILGEQSGLHIVLHVHNGMTEQALIDAAATKRIKLYPLSIYDSVHDLRKESYVLLGFGGIQENCIETVVKLLKEAWFPN
ncbi:GntR family transcriptional regulator [Bacillus pseudomycoides]|uniref:GntR family transcriptional regulator n=1 Tax=Bacillus pseudomycoides TaxID=64104 RepID=A0AA91ZTZ5_9BACI|nr:MULTISPECIES: PLP-dependent aminotransferase family protein [Bacillus]PEB47994.1 GntR family transcriptional regulator [Bacillus sp. AFS098217]PED82872.1 GntR family transcriptional regulator [Bacillus pseudomycoides]PEU09709.1 GntR family transcriptional regulator [Bacillus sp. AFS019443]PEU18404.1 GntR family transcriptional regulator [Bacillus sp. AFS014408]PFW62648.1 GntR family transcriptional regulator [Bacillus sp. AFS075034]